MRKEFDVHYGEAEFGTVEGTSLKIHHELLTCISKNDTKNMAPGKP